MRLAIAGSVRALSSGSARLRPAQCPPQTDPRPLPTTPKRGEVSRTAADPLNYKAHLPPLPGPPSCGEKDECPSTHTLSPIEEAEDQRPSEAFLPMTG